MIKEDYYEEDVSFAEEEQEEVVEVEEKEIFEEEKEVVNDGKKLTVKEKEIASEEKEQASEKNNPDYIYDQVKGGHGKRHILADLNKKKLGNHEMDEMFCEWY